MTTLDMLPAAKGFYYDPSPQRTQGWYDRRLGKVTASKLEEWLSVSKAEKTLGQPLQKRLDYEKELLYERVFRVSYNNYFSDAMEDGVRLEKFAIKQYAKIKGVEPFDVGCWYNEQFVASPDAGVGDDGLVEAKVLRDNAFSSLLTGSIKKGKKGKKGEPDEPDVHIPALSEHGVHSKYWKQMQGQLWASGRKWVDFVAINLNTRKIYIVRVEPDLEFHKWLELSVPEPLSIDPNTFKTSNVFNFVDEAPAYSELPGAEAFNF